MKTTTTITRATKEKKICLLKDEKKKKLSNSVQKFCCSGFSQFLLLYVILGPSSLWESCSCIHPLISPKGSVPLSAPGKALISWEKWRNWEMRPQTDYLTCVKRPSGTYRCTTTSDQWPLGISISNYGCRMRKMSQSGWNICACQSFYNKCK